VQETDHQSTPAPEPSRLTSLLVAMARGLALFLGGFGLLNVLGGRLHPGFDINIWWLDVRWLPNWPTQGMLAAASALMVAFALWPRLSRWRSVLTRLAAAWLAFVAAWNTVTFVRMRAAGGFSGGLPAPLSLVLLVLLVFLVLVVGKGRRLVRSWSLGQIAMVLIVLLVLASGFPLAQMAFFGRTDYARPVDAIVVFGCGVYPNGRMSLALSDRVETACDLYRRGLAEWLVVSGGPGMGDVHETEAMRAAAIEWGVPAERILVDPDGLNTDATVANTAAMFEQHNIRRVLAVSHWYHLPRIKMTYQRAGRSVYTTPAAETRTLTALPYFLMREVAAVWVYYLRPLGI